MITVKQILEQYSLVSDKATEEEIKLSALSEAGIFESSKLPMIRRSLKKNINEMTEAERKTLKSLLESLMDHTLLNEKGMSYPSDKDMPTVIILKRKAIRVFPDNQKIGLYYSQALDRYISIPFGPNIKDLSPQLNEEMLDEISQELATRAYAKRMSKIKDVEDSEEEPAKKAIEIDRQKKKLQQLSYRMRTTATDPTGKNIRPWAGTGSVDIAKKAGQLQIAADKKTKPKAIPITPEMRKKAGEEFIQKQTNLSNIIAAKMGVGLANLAQKIPGLKSRKTVIMKSPIKESFSNNLNMLRERRSTLDNVFTGFGSGLSGSEPPSPEERGAMAGAAYDSARRKGPAALRNKPNITSQVSKNAASEQEKFNKEREESLKTTAGKLSHFAGSVASPFGIAKAGAVTRAGQTAKNVLSRVTKQGSRLGNLAKRGAKAVTSTVAGAGKLAAGAAGLGAAALAAGGDDDYRNTQQREYGFGNIKANVSAPQAATLTGGTLVGALQQAKTFPNIPGIPRQPVYESIKNIVDQNISKHTLQIDEETISINKSVAKKIVKLHESLNRTNQKKLEKMLNEDIVSFRKIINFALKQ